MMCYLYMEMYSLFTALVEFKQGDIFPITDVELSTMMSNTRAYLQLWEMWIMTPLCIQC
jgi:hypothetical protein